MVERLGEMKKGRRERIEKGSRKLNFFFLSKSSPAMAAIVSSSPQGMTSWSSSIKCGFLQAYSYVMM